MTKRITIQAHINAFTGYGQYLLELVKGLEARGVFCALRGISIGSAFEKELPKIYTDRLVWAIQPEPWEILMAPPHHIPTPGKKTVYYTMWETTRLPQESVQLLNMAEVIVVPCKWCKKTFEESGVVRPIVIIPLGFDPKEFPAVPVNQYGPCVFGAAGRVVHGMTRKGIDQVIDCFLAGFQGTDDVRLNIKVHPDDPLPDVKDVRIRVTKAHFTTRQLWRWLCELTAFVSASRGEGWGLIQTQAMAVGRPVIGPIYSGLAEFMTPENCFPVKHSEVDVSGGYRTGKWAMVDGEDLYHQMRMVYLDRIAADARGLRASCDISDFLWEHSIEKSYHLLNEIGAI